MVANPGTGTNPSARVDDHMPADQGARADRHLVADQQTGREVGGEKAAGAHGGGVVSGADAEGAGPA